jgi:hypothetical protein
MRQLVVLEVPKYGDLCCRAPILVSDVVGVELQLLEGWIAHTNVRGLAVE